MHDVYSICDRSAQLFSRCTQPVASSLMFLVHTREFTYNENKSKARIVTTNQTTDTFLCYVFEVIIKHETLF
jgi:hypothetical protein